MNTYNRHRFPLDIISYAVWLDYRFSLSHRNIEDLLAACPDEMVDAIALAGPPDEVRKRFAELSEIADSFTLTTPFYGLTPEKNAYYSEQIAATFYG